MSPAAHSSVDDILPDSLAWLSVPGAETFKSNGILPRKPYSIPKPKSHKPSKCQRSVAPKGAKNKAKRPVDALPTLAENPMPKKWGRPKEGSKKKEKKSTVQIVDNNLGSH
jgi:hypothetical protein